MAAKEQIPTSVTHRELVLAQLEHILNSPSFRNSKRYPRFLRFIVEQALLGHAESLKERLLGIEVFDRPADYDMTVDPIVRVAAGEVRKRLAQYYVEAGHENELRIQLPAGAYVPEFCAPQPQTAPSQPEDAIPAAAGASQDRTLSRTAHRRFQVAILAALSVAGLTAILGIYWVNWSSPIDRFWKPFLDSANSPVICLGNITPVAADSAKGEIPGLRTGANSLDHVALADVEAMNRISAILVQHNKRATVLNSGSATFANLSQQPSVLIGGSSNQWSMRSMQLLRFHIVADISPGVNGILDREDSKPYWVVNFNAPYNSIQKEYALIGRFHDPTTEQPTMIVAGVGANGTIAAAEFLTTPAYLKDFAEHAPRGWESRNIEIILETQMINGDQGPPHVVKIYLW